MKPKASDGIVERQTSLAYLNPEFIESDAGRPMRILSEYLAPLRALQEALDLPQPPRFELWFLRADRVV